MPCRPRGFDQIHDATPEIARFRSLCGETWLVGTVGELGWMNGYAYVNGNPVNHTDPSGMIAETPGNWDTCSLNFQETECTCGPDVTRWFLEEIRFHYWWNIETIIGVLEVNAIGGLGSAAILAYYIPYASEIPYKWIDFNDQDSQHSCPSPKPRAISSSRPWDRPCGGSVTLCGRVCLERSELGNFMYGFSANLWGFRDWQTDVAGYMVGVQYDLPALPQRWDVTAWRNGFDFATAMRENIEGLGNSYPAWE